MHVEQNASASPRIRKPTAAHKWMYIFFPILQITLDLIWISKQQKWGIQTN